MANEDSNRRLLDMLYGWSRIAENPEEHQMASDLYQEAGQIEDGDGEGIAHFVFQRVLFLILDGKPR